MGWIGRNLGSLLGGFGSQVVPIPGVNGKELGGWLGDFLPFKKGGKVGHKAGRAAGKRRRRK